jgi:amidophosphoribosyltransferase
MSGLFALSIDPATYHGDFLKDLFWGTFYQQHLGEDYAGLSTLKEGQIQVRTHRGLFRPAFSNDLKNLEGTEGIGYCGSAREPYFTESRLGKFSLCFTGNIINLPELIERFKNFGHTFKREDDIEVIAKLLAQGENVVEGIKIMNKEIRGAYSLLILSKNGIYAACCPTAHWPLVIGEKKGAVIVASESSCFVNLGFRILRDLKPGEIILIKNGRLETKAELPAEKIQFCSFYWVYTAFPSAIIKGIPASLVRKRLGAALARRDIENGFIPDIVIPVPDSGRFHAIGYHQEFCRQMSEGKIKRVPLYDEILIKYPHTGRSFTPQTPAARYLEAEIKLLTSGENYRNKVVVVCDDSIVRGTQTQTKLVPKLREAGVEEIHFRISNPELLSHCPWGKTTKKGETLASRMQKIEDRIKFLGVEGLMYNTIDDLVEAIGLPRDMLCVDCDR